jgi:hypothetical protein
MEYQQDQQPCSSPCLQASNYVKIKFENRPQTLLFPVPHQVLSFTETVTSDLEGIKVAETQGGPSLLQTPSSWAQRLALSSFSRAFRISGCFASVARVLAK